MYRMSMLSSSLAVQLSAVLALAAIILICWSLGRLLELFHPGKSLVSRITETKFNALMQQESISPKIAATLYRYLQETQGVLTAPLPEDHLMWDLGLTEMQIEESVADLARRLNRSSALEAHLKLPGTVADLAHLLQEMPATGSLMVNQAA